MSDSIGYFGAWGQSGSQSAYWAELDDRGAEWGPCYYDATNVLSSYAVYELPVLGVARSSATNGTASLMVWLGIGR